MKQGQGNTKKNSTDYPIGWLKFQGHIYPQFENLIFYYPPYIKQGAWLDMGGGLGFHTFDENGQWFSHLSPRHHSLYVDCGSVSHNKKYNVEDKYGIMTTTHYPYYQTEVKNITSTTTASSRNIRIANMRMTSVYPDESASDVIDWFLLEIILDGEKKCAIQAETYFDLDTLKQMIDTFQIVQ